MDINIYNEMVENEKNHWWFSARREIIRETINKLNLKKDTILEIGSGTGGNIEMLSELGNLTLLECNEHAIELTKKVYNIEPIKGCLPDESFNKKFDLVLMLDVLEHIDSDQETLDSLKELLTNDGRILITVPAYQWLWSNHDIVHQHKRRYTISKLREMVSENYEISYISYFNFFLSPLIMAVRGTKKILGIEENTEDLLKIGKLNKLFYKIFSFEQNIIPKFSFPFGISIIIVLEKKEDVK